MNIALWIVQGLLAAMYLMAGSMKVFQTAKFKADKNTAWASERPDGFVRFVGTSEMLGSLGLILPLITGILPWLTVVAAMGLALIQLLAMFTVHIPRKEYQAVPVNTVLLALSLFITLGRWVLFA